MKYLRYTLLSLALLGAPSDASASPTTQDFLSRRIMTLIGNGPFARRLYGETRRERRRHARAHASSILRAAEMARPHWESIAVHAGWEDFDVDRDLPALIASLTWNESRFRNVVGRRGRAPSETIPDHGRFAIGPMQVLVPSSLAADCGIRGRQGAARALNNLDLAYRAGACLLTQFFEHAALRDYPTRMGWQQRVSGTRQFFTENPELQSFLPVERYNWGPHDLHDHPHAGHYPARALAHYYHFHPTNECHP